MHLINYDNFEIKISDEAFLVKPIRDLWKKDRTKTKDKFLQQCSIIFFYVDPRSSYNYITDDSERLKAIIEQEGLPENFKIDAELQKAINIYKELTTTTSAVLLKDIRLTIDKVREALKSIEFEDLEEKDKANALKTVTTIVGMIPKLVKDLAEAERVVTKEIEEQGRARGSQELTLFDSGIEL